MVRPAEENRPFNGSSTNRSGIWDDLLGKAGAFAFLTVVSIAVGTLFSLMWYSCHPEGVMNAETLKKKLASDPFLAESSMASTQDHMDAKNAGAGQNGLAANSVSPTSAAASAAAAPTAGGSPAAGTTTGVAAGGAPPATGLS